MAFLARDLKSARDFARWRICALLLWLTLVSWAPARAQEVQAHGLAFERWVCDRFFDGYRPDRYTGKWDIPASINQRYGNVPVNPKAIRWGGSIDLGDALRQYDIDEPFILLVGFWEQRGDHKRFVNVTAAHVEPAKWRQLWGEVDRAALERLDRAIKAPATPDQARREALALKRQAPYPTALFGLHPKIDSRTQRRLQCSLSNTRFWAHLAPGASRERVETPRLWGQDVDLSLASPPRSRAR